MFVSDLVGITGRLDKTTYICEIVSQVVGSLLGAIALRVVIPGIDMTHSFVAVSVPLPPYHVCA